MLLNVLVVPVAASECTASSLPSETLDIVTLNCSSTIHQQQASERCETETLICLTRVTYHQIQSISSRPPQHLISWIKHILGMKYTWKDFKPGDILILSDRQYKTLSTGLPWHLKSWAYNSSSIKYQHLVCKTPDGVIFLVSAAQVTSRRPNHLCSWPFKASSTKYQQQVSKAFDFMALCCQQYIVPATGPWDFWLWAYILSSTKYQQQAPKASWLYLQQYKVPEAGP